MSNSDIATIVTGASTVTVAIAGFISTAWQAGRAQRASEKATRYEEKKDLYIRMMRALGKARDARDEVKVALSRPQTSEAINKKANQSMRKLSDAVDESTLLLPEMILLAPREMLTLISETLAEITRGEQDDAGALSKLQTLMSLDITDSIPKRKFSRKPDFGAVIRTLEGVHLEDVYKQPISAESGQDGKAEEDKATP